MKNLILYFLIALIGLVSCSVEPKKIEYGFDQCTFCEMTIVDQSHSAILVSSTGKTYKFDAIECMLRHSNREEPKKEYPRALVADYLNPSAMVLAADAYYLISSEIPSPMGGNLSALTSEMTAKELRKHKGGEIFKWEDVKAKFR